MKVKFLLNMLDPHMREVARGATIAFIMKLLAGALAFGLYVFIARLLGADGAGIFFLALTVTTLATVLGRLGLDNAALRFIAAGAVMSDWMEVKGVYQKAMILALSASAAAAILMFAGAPLLAESVFSKPELIRPLRTMAFAVVPMALLILHSEVLKALKLIFASQLVYGVAVPGLTLIALLLIGSRWGVDGAAFAFTLAAALTALLGFSIWKLATPHLTGVVGQFSTRRLLKSSLPLFWVASMTPIMGWTGILLLGVWGTSADVGIFTAASRTALLTSLILISVNSIAAPKFAELYRQDDMNALSRTARDSTKFMAVLTLPAVLLFLVAPGPVMGLFGAQFIEGGPVLRILALGQFVSVATGSVTYLLMMSGNERLLRNNLAFAAALNIVLNLIMIPLAGRIGAAVATAISIAWLNLGAAYLVWSRLGILTIPILPVPKTTLTQGSAARD